VKARTGTTLAMAALAVLAGACGRAPARDRSLIVVAVRTPPNNFDPRQGNDETSQRVAQLVFSSLLDVGPDLRVVPRLALRLDNPDPLTYVAQLRRGVKFHDGHELTAKDVVYTYASFLDPNYISPFKGAFRVLQSVRALDDYTVEFRLREPFAAFPAQLAGVPPIVPADSGTSMRTLPIGLVFLKNTETFANGGAILAGAGVQLRCGHPCILVFPTLVGYPSVVG